MSIFAGRFEGRTAAITGGASGAGLATARRLSAEGARVCLWDRDEDALARATNEIAGAHAVTLDVTDADAVAAAAAQTHAAFGRLDILVNAAGITGATVPVAEFPIASWQHVLDVNLNGTFYCCRAVVPLMLQGGWGRIVNLSSVAGKEGNPNASAYSASKAGVLALTKSLGKELAETAIRVNAVTPAAFYSPLLQQMPKSHIAYMRSKIPMGRLGEADEVAALICWLASEECSFSTAATFDMSGGRTTY